jgi:hypothetical protein
MDTLVEKTLYHQTSIVIPTAKNMPIIELYKDYDDGGGDDNDDELGEDSLHDIVPSSAPPTVVDVSVPPAPISPLAPPPVTTTTTTTDDASPKPTQEKEATLTLVPSPKSTPSRRSKRSVGRVGRLQSRYRAAPASQQQQQQSPTIEPNTTSDMGKSTYEHDASNISNDQYAQAASSSFSSNMAYSVSNNSNHVDDDGGDANSDIWQSKVLHAAPPPTSSTAAAVAAKKGRSRMRRSGSSKSLAKSPRKSKQSRKRRKRVSFATASNNNTTNSNGNDNDVQCSVRLVTRLNRADAWPTTMEKNDAMNAIVEILDEYKLRLENAHVETEEYFDALWRLFTMPPLSSPSSHSKNDANADAADDNKKFVEQALSQARREQVLEDLKTLQTSPIAHRVRGLEPYILANHFHEFRQGHADQVLAVQESWRQERERQRQEYQISTEKDDEMWTKKLRQASLETSTISRKFCLGMAQNDARAAARALAVPWSRSSSSSSGDEEEDDDEDYE